LRLEPDRLPLLRPFEDDERDFAVVRRLLPDEPFEERLLDEERPRELEPDDLDLEPEPEDLDLEPEPEDLDLELEPEDLDLELAPEDLDLELALDLDLLDAEPLLRELAEEPSSSCIIT
jgi:uncharacterized protein